MESRFTTPKLITPVKLTCFSGDLLVRLSRGLSKKASSWLLSGQLPIVLLFPQDQTIHFLIRMMRPGEAHLREHYADLAARPFFPGLVSQKWNRSISCYYELPGVLHELRPSGGNGMGRAGCCQDWQVLVKPENPILNRLMSGWCLERLTLPPASLEQSEEITAYRHWQSLFVGILSVNFTSQVGRNICHGSDAVESAEHEIGLWFRWGQALVHT